MCLSKMEGVSRGCYCVTYTLPFVLFARHSMIMSKNQLDAKIINFIINNFDQLNMFRAIISPILRSTKLCLQLVI